MYLSFEKSLKIPTRKSESVNTTQYTKIIQSKGQTTIYKTAHRKQKIE